jgi:hypothetical protein
MEKKPERRRNERPDTDPEEEGSAARPLQPPDTESDRDPAEEGSSGRPQR